MLKHADQDAADYVDGQDHQTRNGVAADKLGGAVHGTEEGGFLLQFLATELCVISIDQSRRQVGVDGHLFAGHGIQGEPRRDLCDPARALGDDDEVHHHQDDEDDDADREIAAHHQFAERLDHLTCAVNTLMAVTEDQPGRGDIERQAEQRHAQQHGRECRELQRLLDQQRGHQDQDRRGDR